MSDPIIDDIVRFWLADSQSDPDIAYARRDWWYDGSAEVDAEIRSRFGEHVSLACAGKLAAWEDTPDGALALILLLDQFTRNIFRGTPDAYRGDALAFEIVNRVIDRKLDRELHAVSRVWLYHPFHHAESLDDQDRGLALLGDVLQAAPEPWHRYINRSIWGWTRHRNIVAQFGRFPHRNRVLGRPNTDAETAFLESNTEAFGQGRR
jgi:uncharacterized protein (DUF924 family)